MKLAGKKLLIVVVFAFLAASVYADQFAGESMAIGVGARPLGMGGAFVGLADDASASYWNPAGLVNVKGVEVSDVKLTANPNLNAIDTAYTYVNLCYNVSNDIGAFGVAWLRQGIDKIQITDNQGDVISNAAGNADNAIYLSYARNLVTGFSFGISGKLLLGNYPATVVNSSGAASLSTINYSGGGVDAGLYLDMKTLSSAFQGLSLGVNVQDIYTEQDWGSLGTPGTDDYFQGGVEQVPLNVKAGLAYNMPFDFLKQMKSEFILAADMDTKYQIVYHVGAEYWWNRMLALRGGIQGYSEISSGLDQQPTWSIGASLRWYFIGLDYAWVNNELTPLQYLSVIGKF